MKTFEINFEGKYFVNFGEDVMESYYIRNKNNEYRLNVTYLGCTETDQIKIDEDMEIEKVDLAAGFGACFELYFINGADKVEAIENLFNEELEETEKENDLISGLDYSSFENTAEIKEKIFTLLNY